MKSSLNQTPKFCHKSERQSRNSFTAIIGLFIICSFTIFSCSTNQSDITNTNPGYKLYLDQQTEILKSLPANKKMLRATVLKRLQNDTLYQHLSNNTSAQYLTILDAIGEAIRVFANNQFYISDSVENKLGKQRLQIVLDHMALIRNGGFTKDMIAVFDRYQQKFGYYGLAGKIGYNANGDQTESVDGNYDLTPIFTVIDSSNKKLANSIYEVVSKGIVNWSKPGDNNLLYPFLSQKREYNNYLKQVDPDSPYILNYDYELTANELWQSYDANEVSADEKYKNKKIMLSGVIERIAKDIMDEPYIILSTNDLGVIQCAFKKNSAVENLSRGNNITVIGTCSGKTMNLVEVSDCKIY